MKDEKLYVIFDGPFQVKQPKPDLGTGETMAKAASGGGGGGGGA